MRRSPAAAATPSGGGILPERLPRDVGVPKVCFRYIRTILVLIPHAPHNIAPNPLGAPAPTPSQPHPRGSRQRPSATNTPHHSREIFTRSAALLPPSQLRHPRRRRAIRTCHALRSRVADNSRSLILPAALAAPSQAPPPPPSHREGKTPRRRLVILKN